MDLSTPISSGVTLLEFRPPQGRALFDQSVLKNPNRSVPVGLGLEMLVQSLVQDNFDCDGMGEVGEVLSLLPRTLR